MIRKALIVMLLLGTVTTAVLWVMSHIVVDRDFEQYGMTEYGVSIDIFRRQGWGLGCNISGGMVTTILSTSLGATEIVEERYHRLGSFRTLVFAETFEPEGRFLCRCLDMPLWFVLALFALYPTIAFIRGPLRRYRRRRKGLCVRCGYDLTGNVTGVCSECGHPFDEGATA